MKPKLYSYLAFVLFAAIFIVACKKGDTGPAGPAGPAGAAGAAGAPGAKGDSATANVTYSAWLDVTFQQAIDPNADTAIAGLYFGYILAPKLTADVISKGQITTYFNFGSAANPDIVTLPYTDIISFGTSIVPDYVVDSIYLTANVNASTQTSNGVKVGQYRYVIIPGTKPASVNTKDYNSVKNYFKLP